MNTYSRTAQGLAAALSDALTPQVSVAVAPALRDFAGIDANKMDQIAYVGQALVDARYSSYGSIRQADFAALEDFLDYLRGAFALHGVARRESFTDRQHSPDGSHFLDRERL